MHYKKYQQVPCKQLIINNLPPPNFGDLEALTRQEEKILQLAADDLSNKEIAAKLGVSLPTIKKHRENIYRKYRVYGKIEVRRFMRRVRKFLEKE